MGLGKPAMGLIFGVEGNPQGNVPGVIVRPGFNLFQTLTKRGRSDCSCRSTARAPPQKSCVVGLVKNIEFKLTQTEV